MSLQFDNNLIVKMQHINKRNNVLFCAPYYMHFVGDSGENISFGNSYITTDKYYTYNTIKTSFDVSTKSFICYTDANPTTIAIDKNVEIKVGTCPISKEINKKSDNISTKRYVDYRSYTQILAAINNVSSSYDISNNHEAGMKALYTTTTTCGGYTAKWGDKPFGGYGNIPNNKFTIGSAQITDCSCYIKTTF